MQSLVRAKLNEKRLYELIWKRTIASQMADAQIEKTTINIYINKDAIKTFNGESITKRYRDGFKADRFEAFEACINYRKAG